MHPDISEFSYGYALTETLINAFPSKMKAAPIFPSLIEEGKKGGGYDVKIPFSGIPIFLQFKLSHCMVRDTADEAASGHFSVPFYRMHLRPTRHSQQHPMLLDLEATGARVFYATPKFHIPYELNLAYVKKSPVGWACTHAHHAISEYHRYPSNPPISDFLGDSNPCRITDGPKHRVAAISLRSLLIAGNRC